MSLNCDDTMALVRHPSDLYSEPLTDLPKIHKESFLDKKPKLKRHDSELTGRMRRLSILTTAHRHAPDHDNVGRRERLYKGTISGSLPQLNKEIDVKPKDLEQSEHGLTRKAKRGSLRHDHFTSTLRRQSSLISLSQENGHVVPRSKFGLMTSRKSSSKKGSAVRHSKVTTQDSIESLPDRSPRGKPKLKRQRTFPQLVRVVKKVSMINLLSRNNGHRGGTHKKLTALQIEQLKRKAALDRFRRAGRMIQLLLRAVDDIKSNYALRKKKQADEILAESAIALPGTMDASLLTTFKKNSGLMFNPADFKPRTKGQLSLEAKRILSKSPGNRTPEEIRMSQMSLQSAMEAFAEFPSKMQESLANVAWYERFEPNRVIIRQGHRSETYYLILSGTAMVTVSSSEYGITGDPGIKHVAFLKKGNTFGEIALMHHAKRAATVVCKDTVELIAIDREDFINIFMHRSPSGKPDFLHFLQTIPELAGWPLNLLPDNDPTICLFTYFRRGVVICKDSNTSDWLYVIKSGCCRVLKKLAAPTQLFEARSALLDVFELTDGQNTGLLKSPSLTSFSSPGAERRRPRNKPMTYQHGQKLKPDKHSVSDKPSSSTVKLPKITDVQLKHRPPILRVESKFQMDLPSGPITPKVMGHTADEKMVYLQIQQLSDKDIFGLQSILFRDDDVGTDDRSPSVTLVSDGAECVMLSKRFFTHHLTTSHRAHLEKSIRPYPSEESLHHKLEQQTTWEQYKCRTMQNAIHKATDNSKD